ncbi:MAG: peptidoglycan DD-metalloendopeptidase family protein [Ignavibacteria bacterium]|nr:peptidoglycan DD-metalloendopeptidase family protein [Ignavibacteria bacterium]MCC7158821.1 peptidoglycan DD-metalloendopeptidase family protein [Ignavibacteria bacterium]
MGIAAQFKITALLILLVIFSGATYHEIITDKRKQADIIDKQIIEGRNLIGSNSIKTSSIKQQIDSVESAINAINSFLKNYENETYMTPDQIAIETNMIIFLAEEVERIQASFRQKVVNIYKHGENYELELLLSSKTPNEYLRRNQYLQKFSQNRKKELRDLKSKKFILEEKKKMLSLSVSSQRFYVESKRGDRTLLEIRLNELKTQKELSENQGSIIEAKIKRYESQLNSIKNFINNFEINRESFKDSKYSRLNYESTELSTVKGSINMPIDLGLITTGFGSIADNKTGNISINNGLDFSISYGSKVYAIAGGVVNLVGELPFYGKVVIIKHDSGYRSVYAILSDVNVSVGDAVKLNQVIGKTGETLEGQTFHFELWKDAVPLNPREWLRF